ncbi:MAG TPA: hypothetical protein VFV94_18540 [Polyangiaceae bacterium]|nr:hypothetical protein [Polyangiaceae bacterium]
MSRLGRLLLLCGTAAFVLTGCPSRESIGTTSLSVLGSGVVNDPQNKSLRFDMLKFGLDSFCHEMLKGGAPLKMADDEPVLGRFFAAGCQSQILDEELRKSFIVQYQGKGYGFGGPVGRVGFEAAGLIEYAPDFQLHDGAMYVYFRPRLVDTSKFQLLLVESELAQTAAAALGVSPEAFGKKIVDSQLRRGFTVVRYGSSGETEFGMGIIPPGEKPFHPFHVETEDKRVLVNERTEVHGGQQDYVGAFDVEGSDQALYLTVSVDGAPSIDVLVVPQAEGDKLIDGYVRTRGPQTVAGRPLLDEPVPAGALFRRFVKVPAGRYYLLLDHGNRRGHGPAPGPVTDQAAKVDYLILLGDAP